MSKEEEIIDQFFKSFTLREESASDILEVLLNQYKNGLLYEASPEKFAKAFLNIHIKNNQSSDQMNSAVNEFFLSQFKICVSSNNYFHLITVLVLLSNHEGLNIGEILIKLQDKTQIKLDSKSSIESLLIYYFKFISLDSIDYLAKLSPKINERKEKLLKAFSNENIQDLVSQFNAESAITSKENFKSFIERNKLNLIDFEIRNTLLGKPI